MEVLTRDVKRPPSSRLGLLGDRLVDLAEPQIGARRIRPLLFRKEEPPPESTSTGGKEAHPPTSLGWRRRERVLAWLLPRPTTWTISAPSRRSRALRGHRGGRPGRSGWSRCAPESWRRRRRTRGPPERSPSPRWAGVDRPRCERGARPVLARFRSPRRLDRRTSASAVASRPERPAATGSLPLGLGPRARRRRASTSWVQRPDCG